MNGIILTILSAISFGGIEFGWSQLPDGRVELVAEGERAELEEFLQAVRDSGLRRNIRDEDIVWEEAQDKFRGFEIAG